MLRVGILFVGETSFLKRSAARIPVARHRCGGGGMENNLHEPPGVVVSDAEPKPQSSRGLRLLTRLIVAFLAMPFRLPSPVDCSQQSGQTERARSCRSNSAFSVDDHGGRSCRMGRPLGNHTSANCRLGRCGSGTGLVLDGVLGCLDPGEVLGPSVLVLGLVFMVIGYRQDPHDRSLG